MQNSALDSLWQSRTIWLAVAAAMLSAMQTAPDGMFEDSTLFLAGVLAIGCNAAIMAVRTQTHVRAKTGLTGAYPAVTDAQAEKAVAAPSKRRQKGFVVVEMHAGFGLLIGAVLIAYAVLFSSGCSSPPVNPCKTSYLYDGDVYYRLDECPGQAPIVICTSKLRLPNPNCK